MAMSAPSGVMAQEGGAKPSSAKKSSGSSAAGLPLLTISGTYEFLKSSVFLSLDLLQFSTYSLVDLAMSQAPLHC